MNYVYLIADTERSWVKVRGSNDPFNRLKQLNSRQAPLSKRVACPAIGDQAYEQEKKLQAELKAKNEARLIRDEPQTWSRKFGIVSECCAQDREAH